jgi:hypothetical protein
VGGHGVTCKAGLTTFWKRSDSSEWAAWRSNTASTLLKGAMPDIPQSETREGGRYFGETVRGI